jgi:eukaryotic-like serine/threonine-protein kinase
VKLLDFGLAKLLRSDDPSELSKTEQRHNTAEGAVLGTVAYMSPEQVRGQAIDHRTDVFSFGIVLYEMLTGGRPFNAPSNVETMAAIINEDPPPLPASAPPALERIVLHAMEKSPANRFQSMKDVVFALDTFSGSGETSAVSTKKRSRPAKKIESREIRYQRVSYRRGFIMTARFAPDGSVIYGATWEDQPQEIFSMIPGTPESRASGFVSADILAVSSTGELAVSLGRRFIGGWVTSGTLARAPLFGGAPRELSEEIQDADWIDGKQLAVIRHTRDGHVIEAPLGTAIHESQHWISNLRMSPRGDRVAFLEHEFWGDDGGRLVILDLRGQRVAQSQRWSSIGGLAWTPGGEEVWTAAERERSVRDLLALSLTGKERTVLPAPGRLTLHDIARDGRVLIGVENGRREIMAGTRGGERERNLSWLDWSFLSGISPDGSRIVFEEQAGGRRGSAVSGVYVRKVDGSPAVRLGEGTARSFSPDGLSIGVRPAGADYLDIVPIRVGTARRVPLGDWEEVVWWEWTPDGKQMVVWGHQAGGGSRHFAIAVDGGAPPRPITPEGSKVFFAIAPDSARLLTQMPDDRLVIVPFDGSDQQPVPGAEAGDRPLQWSADGGSIFVSKPGRVEVAIDRIELSTGTRSRWQLLRPDDPAGIMDIFPIVITRDGASYAYSYRRFMSDLYIVEGLV